MRETKNPELTADLYGYVLDHNPPLDPVQRELVDTTHQKLPDAAGLQTAEEQGPLLSFLVRLTGARQIVEVGTFTGFSALSMALALPEDGRLIACDVSEEWTALGREAWAKAGVADRIDLRIAPAIETLRALPGGQWVDLVFLDADKDSYIDYWEELVPRLVPGGLIVADNTLFHGQVTDPAAGGGAAAIRAFNDRIQADERVDHVLLTVADGLTLARKR
ncbi:caffeoyl-CoA O-methyltransferase [Streptomyces sp. DvalAA-14]|uniref:O-methyltransferase n=1 Tax=unclassified Streptomyces TaxID=2593676 RepID=UPI00081B668C|nr:MULTISPECIES: class I SAM-dependent methyltransferase [unclassified Streptomyces]MYS23550.1 O-methyltransferase [Streptomyces sp. SID4948]SCE35170.1 caffeoyl-CoA O-methyltransferase [Streptomyces sp. DvalAA-14]